MENTKPAGTAPGYFRSLKQDFLSSIVVFLVALPLCMGIAIASSGSKKGLELCGID
jgi:MFS superfamily sulfate permease-like transporter